MRSASRLALAAAFLAAGGYHHHIGANVWQSRGAPPAPDSTAALRYATLILPSAEERDRVAGRLDDAGFGPEARPNGDVIVTDPSRNPLLLTVA